MAHAKGDVRAINSGLRVECKTTSKKSYSLSIDDIIKIQGEALSGGAEEWAMQIEFQGQMGHHRKVAVIDWATYRDLRVAQETLNKIHNCGASYPCEFCQEKH